MDHNEELIALTADIVAAHVGHNEVPVAELPALIRAVHEALAGAGAPAPETPAEPAVPIRQSVRRDHIVCLEDGAKLKMLKRYLRTRFDMTPDEYRRKWGLPHDYPMVAPAYAEARRGLARKIGLGRKSLKEGAAAVAGTIADAASAAIEAVKPQDAALAGAVAKGFPGAPPEPAKG